MRVCVLDADPIPSDQPFSTHAIAPPGMDRLDELGVGSRVRAVAPSVRVARITVGNVSLDMHLPEDRAMYAPRRSVLDPLLAEAAVSAGAELRDRTAVLDVMRDDGRVTGVVARSNGARYEVRARWVIGADGRNSTIAKRVAADEYNGAESERGGYWAYFPNNATFSRFPFQTYIEIEKQSARFAFQTDSDLVVAGALDLPSVAKRWSDDPNRHVDSSLGRSDVIRHLVEGNRAATRYVGLIRGRWFFRTPVGSGWALVGDAGLHKDPTPGYGITDALRDAKALAAALIDGREAALEVYWRNRDVQSVPLYENALNMGSLAYDNPFNEIVFTKVNESPVLLERMRATIERTLSPFEALPPWRVLGWTAGALLRGKTEIVPHFLATAKRGNRVAKELKLRKALLERAKQRLSAR
jgi:flavin-dependent dehydrogenase